jgi:hypothetical protein
VWLLLIASKVVVVVVVVVEVLVGLMSFVTRAKCTNFLSPLSLFAFSFVAFRDRILNFNGWEKIQKSDCETVVEELRY